MAKARAGLRPVAVQAPGVQAPIIHASSAGAFIDGEMLDALEEIEAFEDDDDPERNDPTAPMGAAIAALNARDYFAEPDGTEGYDAVGYDTAGRALAGRDAAHDVDFGAPRRRAAAKLPIANLEMPTGERLDLTPSPVPRVALAPATGSVDISLVPGPHASRNLPTLAAQHLLGAGRRQQQPRRPAAAVTVPPPGRTNSHLELPAPRRSGALARDVRSSKREIVLGLAIGLGLSMLLAGLGQAYLKNGVEDVIAAVPPQPPAQLESLTLAARPQTPPGSITPPSAASPSTAPPNAAPPSTPEKRAAEALLASNTAGSHSSASGGRAVVASRAVPARASGSKRSVEPRAPRRASTARVLANASARRNDGALPAEPPALEAGKSFDEAPPPPRSPLSPAESAGLGLDLPL